MLAIQACLMDWGEKGTYTADLACDADEGVVGGNLEQALAVLAIGVTEAALFSVAHANLYGML